MTDKKWITVSQASEKINIPVETIRRYIKSHSVHLRVTKKHNKYFIESESIPVMEKIRAFYAEGKNQEEVEDALSQSGIAMTITVKNEDDESVTVSVTDELREIKQALEEQKEFNKHLIEEMKRQQEYIKNSIEKRDQQLMLAFRESQQAKIESAAAEYEVKKEKGFFSRLFKKD